VTSTEVIIENCLPEVRKILPVLRTKKKNSNTGWWG